MPFNALTFHIDRLGFATYIYIIKNIGRAGCSFAQEPVRKNGQTVLRCTSGGIPL